jgi:hypothetical protein
MEEQVADESFLAQELIEALASLPDQEWRVVVYRHRPWGGGRPMTYDEIGRVMGLTPERVRQLMAYAYRKLSEYPTLRAAAGLPDSADLNAALVREFERELRENPEFRTQIEEIQRVLGDKIS